MSKNVVKTITIIFPVIIALFVIFFIQINRKNKENAGLPTAISSPTSIPSFQDKNASDKDLIKQALIKKHGWDPQGIDITISKNDGVYATGGAGSATPGPGGGIWFAVKVNNNWEIVWDGNGIVACADLIDYPDFPASLIPQCYDFSSEKMIQR